MPSRVLLINANRCTMPDPVFPLGLAFLAAGLRRAGHTVEWVDPQVDAEPVEEVVARWKPAVIGISLRNIDDVVITRKETYYDPLGALCQSLRARTDCPIVLGGSGYSIYPRELLELSGADFGVHGEGEESLVRLVAALESHSDYRTIPGLVFRDADRLVVNPRPIGGCAEKIEPEDRPARLLDYYLRKSSMLNLQTQRGCSFHCCYCTYPVIEGRRHRRRPPEVIADELEQMEAQGARYVFFVDSVFNSSPVHVLETCRAIANRRLSIQWGCFLRPQGLTGELMKAMAEAGLAHIEFGSDSFCDRVLQVYGKHFRFEDICHSTELARRHKIPCCHFLICGGPGETEETLAVGFENSRCLREATIFALVGMRIYPGTALMDRAMAEGRLGPEEDLLRPKYYLAEGLTEGRVLERLRQFARVSPNWIVGDPSAGYGRFVEKLRRRGVTGPLWSYLGMMQQLWPSSADQTAGQRQSDFSGL